jgi:signal peptide peptidase SppA
MRQLLRLISHFASTPWALEAGALEALAGLLARAQAGGQLDEAEISAAILAKASPQQPYQPAGAKESVAVIAVRGVIAHRANMVNDICGPSGTSTEMLDQVIRAAAADPSVRSIVLDVDSPGGSVYGVQEIAQTILETRASKPIAAVANAIAASAAYWIASAAHEVYVIPSGEVGSIGVLAVHTDTSKADDAAGKVTTVISAGKYKAEGAGPLTDDAKAYLQSRIDGYYTAFVRGVAKARGVSTETVREGYGQGRVLGAQQALAAGMVDGIATLPEVIQKYARRTTEAANKPRALTDAQIRIAAAALPPTRF